MILGIYCAGNLGRSLLDIANRINKHSYRWDSIVFVDDVRQEQEYYGTKVLRLADFPKGQGISECVIANGVPDNRYNIYKRLLSCGCNLTTLIDPTAIVSPSAHIGNGTVIRSYAFVGPDVSVADNTLVLCYANVPHDVRVDAHSVIGSNACLGGGVSVGKHTYIGQGAIVRENLQLGDHCIVGMGAVVLHDVDDDSVVVGSPAKCIRKNGGENLFLERREL